MRSGYSRKLISLGTSRETWTLLALILLSVIFSSINPDFLKIGNIQTILRASAFIGIMSVGVTWLLISGMIDLSIGAIAGLAAIVSSSLIVKAGAPLIPSYIAGILLGGLVGFINYNLTLRMKIPALLATVGTMYVCRGLAQYISDGFPVYPLPKIVEKLAVATPFGLSWHFIIFISLAVISQIVLWKTVFGLEVKATGSDREIAYWTEVNVKKVSITTFVIAGSASALAGLLLMSRIITGQPSIGIGWELNAITACAIGGVSLFGYEGSFIGMFIGVILLQVIQNGLVVVGVSPYANQTVVGIILVVTASLDLRHHFEIAKEKSSS